MTPLTIICSSDNAEQYQLAQWLSETLGCPISATSELPESNFAVLIAENDISIADCRGKKAIRTSVDFTVGSKAHRRKYGGGKGQAIAKAVGLNKQAGISVLDATAGMGGDAFVLATLGCYVTMVERSPIVRVLLQDGLRRASEFAAIEDAELQEILSRMTLVEDDSLEVLQSSIEPPQVVYLDPMFPERKKSAEVKKEMQIFHALVGDDSDADQLLEPALKLASHRVVVKRPKIAPYLNNREPGYQLVGKANRFDIYPLKAFSEKE